MRGKRNRQRLAAHARRFEVVTERRIGRDISESRENASCIATAFWSKLKSADITPGWFYSFDVLQKLPSLFGVLRQISVTLILIGDD